ncbi:DUF1367 family protein [Testudinibacter sp. P80/BLE/0925]
MKAEMIKNPGGVLCPADEMFVDDFKQLENGGIYVVEIKKINNPKLHRKLFSFFKFCFEHWVATGSVVEFANEKKQFDHFRKRLIILAGYYDELINFDTGEITQEAQSLKFDQMDNTERAKCLSDVINTAIRTVFNGTTDQNVINQLYSFF